MISTKLILVLIPAKVWSAFPLDRSLAALALDAFGAARRIQKRVNQRLERSRFAQMCTYIESTALDLAYSDRYARHRFDFGHVTTEQLDDNAAEPLASSFLKLLQAAASHETDPAAATRITSTVFPPGGSTVEYLAILEQIADNFRAFDSCFRTVIERSASRTATKIVKDVFARCAVSNSGVVLIVSPKAM